MSVLDSDIVFNGSQVMPDGDATNNVGGAIDTSVRVELADIGAAGTLQIVASASADTSQGVTVTGRDAAGVIQSEALSTNGADGQTAASGAQTFERLLKAVKGGTFTGDVALEASTASATGTAQGGAAKTASADANIQLAAAEVTSDDDFKGEVVRITGGTGAGQIRRILGTTAATDTARVDRDWDTVPDGTSTYRISQGIVLEKTLGGAEITKVRRIHYDAAADPSGGSTKNYYEKIFIKNAHATLAVTSATVAEALDSSGVFDFDLESTLDGSDSTGAGNNRQTAPSGYTFDGTTKNVANSQALSAGSAQGLWSRLQLAAGAAAADSGWTPQLNGQST